MGKNGQTQTVLIIGASSAIGQAMIEKYQSDDGINTIICISRSAINYTCDDKISHLLCDYSEQSISALITQLSAHKGQIGDVIICNGQLHDDHIQPEKRLADIDFNAMATLFEINTLVPLRWIKHLLSLCQGESPCKIVCLSARVGSISDNQLGGWYSYRASKAALNMALKTAAIEYWRSAKNIKLIAFHPGTTDTPLSKPFQKNVKPEQLFTPSKVADYLSKVLQRCELDGQLSYLDWAAKPIPW